MPSTSVCKHADGREGDGWCPDSRQRARLRCVAKCLFSIGLICPHMARQLQFVCISLHDVRLMLTFCVSRLELAAVRAAQELLSAQGADGSGEEARDDEARAHIAEDDGDFHRCADLYSKAADLSLALSNSELDAVCRNAHATEESKWTEEYGKIHRGCDKLLPIWRQADLLVAAAHCHRRAMSDNIDAADAAAEGALRLFPRHADALHAKGVLFKIFFTPLRKMTI